MSTTKDSSNRSSSQHRLSGPGTASLPMRQSNSRHHSHSLSLGSISQTHRVSRRKSVTANSVNVAAMAAAVAEETDYPGSRRSLHSKSSASAIRSADALPIVGSFEGDSFATLTVGFPQNSGNSAKSEISSGSPTRGDSVLIDGPPLSAASEQASGANNQSRSRRASEGSHLIKGDSKRESASGGDLRCDKCGKGYKHSSCLTKHLWEHTPEWSYTSKLLISKHQQVQLLEAASVLVAMNVDGTPVEATKDSSSDDHSSASPAASGSSGTREDASSADTTPPPQTDEHGSGVFTSRGSRAGRSKRYSSNGSSYSRSYQSARSPAAISAASAPSGSMLDYYPYGQAESRPPSSGVALAGQGDDEEAGLAAAVELLSCSFGTPRSGPVTLPPDVPPVPPLPARYMDASQRKFSNSAVVPGYQIAPVNSDVRMNFGEGSVAEDEDHEQHYIGRGGRSDEEDDGVFGRMEE
ncbi:MAG: hypothetical protein M1825_006380 [Sarcosagium campestre]|nr:MAG: hypothetical protein M1825_006380 [Sarcosagium campestre]